MDYFDKFTSEENLNNYKKMEITLYQSSEGIEDIDSVLGLEDGEQANVNQFKDQKYDREIARWERMIEYKSRRIVNANRSASTVKTLYDTFTGKFKAECDAARLPIMKFVMEYIKTHMEDLSTRGPSRRVYWLTSDTQNFFNATKIKDSEIKDIIKKCDSIKANWNITSNPLNMLMSLLACYYWNNMTKEEKNAKNYKNTMVFIINLIFTIRFYSSLQYKYLPYGADETEMDSVIDDISSRFNIKQCNSMYELLEYIAYTNVKNASDLMANPTDYNINYFMENLNSRINSCIKGVVNEYRKKYDSGKRTSVDTMEKTNTEGDRYLDVADNISNDITTITRKIMLKLSGDSTVSETLLQVACKQTKVSISKMKITLENMAANDKDLISQLISLILSYYLGVLKKPKNTIRSVGFITIMKKVYGISNTNVELVIKMKDVLETLMKRNSKEFLTTNRVATLSNLKATCYFYWVLYINAKCE